MVRESSVCVALAYTAFPLEAEWWHMQVALAVNLGTSSPKSYFGALGMLSFFSAYRLIDIVIEVIRYNRGKYNQDHHKP